jgi:hypothetical protein
MASSSHLLSAERGVKKNDGDFVGALACKKEGCPQKIHFRAHYRHTVLWKGLLTDLDLSNPQPETRPGTATSTPRWIPPPSGVSKLNVDAALSKNSRKDSVAAVARDGVEKFLGASSVVKSGNHGGVGAQGRARTSK